MQEMSIKIIEIQRELISLKSPKVKDSHEETPQLVEVDSEKVKKQDEMVLESKQENIDKNEIINTINEKCENMEAKITEQEYEKLSDVA